MQLYRSICGGRNEGRKEGRKEVSATEQPDEINAHPYSMLQVPTTQLDKMSIDPKLVELTADVLETVL